MNGEEYEGLAAHPYKRIKSKVAIVGMAQESSCDPNAERGDYLWSEGSFTSDCAMLLNPCPN